MSAEDLGARLLGEVEEESLDKVGDDEHQPYLSKVFYLLTQLKQLLKSVRYLDDPQPQSRLGIPALDKLLNIFQYPYHQDLHLHQRQWDSPQPISPATHATPRLPSRTPVIELTSAAPCSGVTQLLYYITAIAILPSTFSGLAIQGKQSAVVVLDTAGTFDVLRLQQTMQQHIEDQTPEEAKSAIPAGEIEALIRASLQHVHIFRPQSTASLLATIANLPSYLRSTSQHFSSDRPLHAIVLDGISAFVWQDRMHEETRRQTHLDAVAHSTSFDTGNTNCFVNQFRQLVKSLRTIQALFDCVVVAANWGLLPVPAAKSASRTMFRPHLPAVWTNFCTLKLIVEEVGVPKFRESLSVRGAWAEAKARQDVVGKGARVAFVNWWGCEEWAGGVREMLEREGEAFRFWVRAEGVLVEGELFGWRAD